MMAGRLAFARSGLQIFGSRILKRITGEAADESVDHLFVGAGPSTLVRAIGVLGQGRSCLVLDEAPLAGGAWAAYQCFDSSAARVDVVAHLLSAYANAYDLLAEAAFLVERRPLLYWVASHQPHATLASGLSDEAFVVRSAFGGTICAYHQYHLACYQLSGTSASPEAAHAMVSEFQRFRYLSGSFQPVIDRLTQNFIAAGGRFRLGTRLQSCKRTHVGVSAHTTTGRIRAAEVTVSRHLSWPVLGFDRLADVRPAVNVHRSVLVLVRVPQVFPLFYVNLVGHPLFAAIQVSRLSQQADDAGFAYSFCLVTGHDHFADLSSEVQALLEGLAEAKLMPKAFTVCELKFHRREVSARRSADLQAAASRMGAGRVGLSVVDNLAQDMSEHVQAWSAALSARSSIGTPSLAIHGRSSISC